MRTRLLSILALIILVVISGILLTINISLSKDLAETRNELEALKRLESQNWEEAKEQLEQSLQIAGNADQR